LGLDAHHHGLGRADDDLVAGPEDRRPLGPGDGPAERAAVGEVGVEGSGEPLNLPAAVRVLVHRQDAVPVDLADVAERHVGAEADVGEVLGPVPLDRVLVDAELGRRGPEGLEHGDRVECLQGDRVLHQRVQDGPVAVGPGGDEVGGDGLGPLGVVAPQQHERPAGQGDHHGQQNCRLGNYPSLPHRTERLRVASPLVLRRRPKTPADPLAHVSPDAAPARFRSAVADAVEARRRFADVAAGLRPGPVQDRLAALAEQVDAGVLAVWDTVVRAGEVERVASGLDAERATDDYKRAKRDPAADPALVEALRERFASVQRLLNAVDDVDDRLRLLDARLGAAVARAAEVALVATDSSAADAVSSELGAVVDELGALRDSLGSLT
jgi:hypothetical protein